MKKLIKLIVWAGIFMSFAKQTEAQVWVGTIPSYYNPSFAGGADMPRLSTYSFINTSKNGLVANQHYLSYDQYISKIASGIGFNLEYNNRNSVNLLDLSKPDNFNTYYRAEMIIAPKISINGKWTISPSVSASVNHQHFRLDETPFNPSLLGDETNLHLGAGLLLNSKRFYLGYSIYHLPTAVRGGRYSTSPWTSMVQAGYTFQRSEEANFAFTPQLLWIIRNEFTPTRNLFPAGVSLNFRYKNILFGMGQTPEQSPCIMIGYQSGRFRIMHMFVTHLDLEEGSYAGSLSFRYLFGNPK
ncbi:type IX secretion system membrane protein PorP/SprF [Cytophagaceae bacterium ABcell3]|nr:type IX secretion system membrane protein PorP/SprF [Cytophagaceae bacterium ABcell3]